MVADTDEATRAIQLAATRRLSASERVRLAVEMSEAARRIAIDTRGTSARRRIPRRMTELRVLLERLVRMLDSAGVPFMIAGSFASTAHGLPRTTQDLDVVIDPPSPHALDALVASMSSGDYYVDADAARDALRRRSMFNVIDHASGWKVDFIIRKNRAFSRDEFARRMQLTLLDVPVFVASPEEAADGVTHAAFDHDFSNLQRNSEDDRKASTLRQPENGKSRPV